jgi:hypothetical protein
LLKSRELAGREVLIHPGRWGGTYADVGGRSERAEALFYEFSPDHLLRSIDRFVGLDKVRCEQAPFYSDIGRPFARSGTDDTVGRKQEDYRVKDTLIRGSR